MFAFRVAGVAVVAAIVGVLAMTTPASAHAALKSSTPASGATITSAPTEVALQFIDPPVGDTTITVTGPDGTDATAGTTQVTGTQATVALRPPLPNGLYTVAYSTVTADGHPMTGAVEFTLAAPAPGDRGAMARPGWDKLLLLLPIPALFLVLLILGARSRRRPSAADSPLER